MNNKKILVQHFLEPQYKSKCIRVIDGDTIVVNIDLGLGVSLNDQRIRLLDVYAPELRDPFGYECKEYLESLLENNVLQIAIQKRGKYGRWLGTVYVGNNDINAEISRWVKNVS